ncbi:MAG: protein kinase [Thermofilaceae archaeon]
MLFGRKIAHSSNKVPRGSELEVCTLRLSEHEAPCLISFDVRPKGLNPGPLEVLVEKAGEKEAVKKGGRSFLLRTAGEYKIKVRNLAEFEQEVEYIFSRKRVKRLSSVGNSYYGVMRLGRRCFLITDGSKFYVLKKLSDIWHFLEREKFSGVRAWLYLSSLGLKGIPRLLQLNVEHKFVVYEYVEGEPLSLIIERRRRCREGERARVDRLLLEALQDVAKVMSEVSKHRILHRDLKPRHIILSGGKTYVIDWELSCMLGECTLSVGTNPYASPEAFQRNYSEKSDVYSFGVIMDEAFIWEMSRETIIGTSEGVAASVKNLIEKATKGKPEERPSFEEISKELEELLKNGEKVEFKSNL